MALKRGRSRSRVSRARAMSRSVSKSRKVGAAWKTRKLARLSQQVTRITRTIETKEAQWKSAVNVNLPHNNVHLILKSDGGQLNPFQTSVGADDPMGANSGQRIGDEITIRGMKFTGFFEGSLARSKVHFRIMLIRMAKGDTVNRASLFQGKSDNKMLDVVNTERYSIIWQTKFNVTPPNAVATGVVPPGVPGAGQTSGSTAGITGNRIINAWIPGRKFGKNGVIRYENSSTSQIKFYDYRFIILAYDWYGTPQDVNNVGVINECYSCVYFKDA